MTPERTLISVSQSEEERLALFTRAHERKRIPTYIPADEYFAILETAACGFKNREISALLDIPLPSVMYRLRKLYQIFDIDAQTSKKRKLLIKKAVELDILPRTDLAIFKPILFDREIEVVELVARGFSNQEIAMELGKKPNSLSAHTVKKHISNSY